MAKFYGKIGFDVQREIRPGVWEGETEKYYRGDVLHTIKRINDANEVNDNINIENKISIVADMFAVNNFSDIKYVEYLGTKWKVSSAEVKYPRIELNLGGVYNGPTTQSS